MKILLLPEATKTEVEKTMITLSSDNNASVASSQESVKPSDTPLDKAETDSDATIIYKPPRSAKPKKTVTFETVTHGIKITKKARMYKCPVCGIKKTSIQSINEHYRRRHKKVQCIHVRQAIQ